MEIIKYRDDITLREVLTYIDESGKGFLCFINDEGQLYGVVTDGDVRRAILNQVQNISEYINTEPETMLDTAGESLIVNRLKELHRRHMPLVDEQGVLKSIFSLDDYDFGIRDNVAVIMAGGLGSRLGELTKTTPKPMLDVGGKPMLQHLIEQLRAEGFSRIVLCVNYKKEVIKDYFKGGREFGVSISYVEEEKRMGTAGALSLIEKDTFTSPFVVMNADILAEIEFSRMVRFLEGGKNSGVMGVRAHEVQVPYGVVNCEGSQIVSLEEKPKISVQVNAGVYVLQPEVLEFIPADQFFDMPSLFEILTEYGLKCSAYEMDGYWIDVGRKEDLDRAIQDMSI